MDLKKFINKMGNKAVSYEIGYGKAEELKGFSHSWTAFKTCLTTNERKRHIKQLNYIDECIISTTKKRLERIKRKAGSRQAADIAFLEVELERLKGE